MHPGFLLPALHTAAARACPRVWGVESVGSGEWGVESGECGECSVESVGREPYMEVENVSIDALVRGSRWSIWPSLQVDVVSWYTGGPHNSRFRNSRIF